MADMTEIEITDTEAWYLRQLLEADKRDFGENLRGLYYGLADKILKKPKHRGMEMLIEKCEA